MTTTRLSTLAFLVLTVAGQALPDTTRLPMNHPDQKKPRSATLFSVPAETRSTVFTATIDGRPAAVTHATRGYHCLSFDLTGPVEISVTAPSDDYWAKGIEVQPWRLNIRPALTRARRVATFRLTKPAKLSITRPGDHGGGAEMLYIFANAPERNPPRPGQPNVRYYAPGVYHEYIDAKSGDFIYIAAGAVIFGGLNIWGVENVKVAGRGTIIHNGPQNPARDEGWMQRKNWHVIGMDDARHVEIRGITCIARSRTWMIQMRNSRDILFDDVKVVGGCPGDANVDAFDWLGGGDTVIRDCFVRAADDIFALYGNFVGYGDENMRTPGLDVTNITVEKCVLSTSISNIVRTSFPKKVFNSANFVMRDSDIIHGGTGGCGVPFAVFEIWADQGAEGRHVSYSFENIWLEYWYSLLHLRQPKPAIRDITFRNIWALGRPSMVPSVVSGDVTQVRMENVKLAGTVVNSDSDLPLEVESGAQAPVYVPNQNTPIASFTVAPAVIRPGEPVTLDAGVSSSKAKVASYEWLFGDGTQATGKRVQHSFPDTDGTLRDGSGQFRVLLKVTDTEGRFDWAYQPVMVSASLQPGVRPASVSPGLNYRYYDGTFTSQTDFDSLQPVASGRASGLNGSAPRRSHDFGMVYEGYLSVPVDGAYAFFLMSRDAGRLEIDSQTVANSPAPFPQRCGSVGNSVQGTWGVRALKAGLHAIRVTATHGKGSHAFGLKWQGPGFSLKDIPDSAFFRDGR